MVSKPHEEGTKSEFSFHTPIANDSLVEQAAEQLAILLWKTWLHKKSIDGRGSGRKGYPKKPSTVS
jgi:hypothetical protein